MCVYTMGWLRYYLFVRIYEYIIVDSYIFDKRVHAQHCSL